MTIVADINIRRAISLMPPEGQVVIGPIATGILVWVVASCALHLFVGIKRSIDGYQRKLIGTRFVGI